MKKKYFGMKKRTAVFSFKKRTKYGKNVLVGSSGIVRLCHKLKHVSKKVCQKLNSEGKRIKSFCAFTFFHVTSSTRFRPSSDRTILKLKAA